MTSVLTLCENVPCGPGCPRATGEDLLRVVSIDSKENAVQNDQDTVHFRYLR